MALIDTSKSERYYIPHEPGEYMDIRPATAREVAKFGTTEAGDEQSFEMLAACVTAWSYDAELTKDNLEKLDVDTWLWLMTTVKEASGLRDDDEKKDSETGSSPGPSQNGARSRKKSATS